MIPEQAPAPGAAEDGALSPEDVLSPSSGEEVGGDARRGQPAHEPEAMVQMLFSDVTLVLPSTRPVVLLTEADPPHRELRIPVGAAEGVAISYAARQLPTPRPLTHETVSRLLDTFELTLDAVRIYGMEGAIFLAEIVVSGRLGVRAVDCRASDAICLALRRSLPVPITVARQLLDTLGEDSASAN